ncbi:MAG: Gfo/Idh/MocA family protein [Candidatus Hermodarchaeota archaeon]
MDFINYGIIGTGVAWKYHQFGIRHIPQMKFKSVFDINERSGRNTAKASNMDYFSDLDKFLSSDIDAVIIMVPHYLHEEYVLAAAKAGKHVLCEKPMATTLEGCDKMINATKKAGVKFMIAENHRFLPAHKYIMETVEAGLVGEVFLVRSYEGVNEIKALMKKGFWKGHPIMAGGGSLIDMGAHKFATINWILNDIAETATAYLSKQCTNLKEKAEDNAISILKYKKGTLVEVTVSFSVVSPFSNSLEVYGTKGSIIENHDWQNPIRIFSKHKNMGENYGKWYEPKVEHGPFPVYYEISMRNEDSHFTNSIINDFEPQFTPEQAKEAIFNVLLSYLSAKKGSLVTREELMQIYNTIGTKTVLEGLEKVVHNNYIEIM